MQTAVTLQKLELRLKKVKEILRELEVMTGKNIITINFGISFIRDLEIEHIQINDTGFTMSNRALLIEAFSEFISFAYSIYSIEKVTLEKHIRFKNFNENLFPGNKKN